jgi:thiamine-monophosphate kinase
MTADTKLDEFERIARYFAPLAAPEALGLLDDVALIEGPSGVQYVLKTDAIVEGVHFLPDDPADQVAQKLLRVNLSDLAAKGASPVGYLLTTALPHRCDELWLERFSAGLARDQAEFGIALLGGDSVATPGPITLSLAAVGKVEQGKAILRRGAQPGHDVFVSGTLGDAALGLKVLQGGLAELSETERAHLVDRYRLPRPRLALGLELAGTASAMLDVSDGLVADLDHLCAASAVGAVVEAAALPLSPGATAALAAEPGLFASVLGGGDDYELLFTAPTASRIALDRLAANTGIAVTRIGRIVDAPRQVRVIDAQGRAVKVASRGYRHF